MNTLEIYAVIENENETIILDENGVHVYPKPRVLKPVFIWTPSGYVVVTQTGVTEVPWNAFN